MERSAREYPSSGNNLRPTGGLPVGSKEAGHYVSLYVTPPRFGNTEARFSYDYAHEPYRIFDFAFDPSVINSIVQPSSLVIGYTYRPYTAHTAIFGIRYYW